MRIKSISCCLSILLALGMLASCAQEPTPANQVASPALATSIPAEPAEEHSLETPANTPANVPTQAPDETSIASPTEIPIQPTSPFVQTTKIIPPTVNPKETTVSQSPLPSNEIDPNLEPLIQLAIKDLAGRLDIPQDQIEVLSAQAVVWSDPSMGCPAPDMRYIQVPQDGTLIRLQAGGQVYEYHSGGNKAPFLCENPS